MVRKVIVATSRPGEAPQPGPRQPPPQARRSRRTASRQQVCYAINDDDDSESSEENDEDDETDVAERARRSSKRHEAKRKADYKSPFDVDSSDDEEEETYFDAVMQDNGTDEAMPKDDDDFNHSNAAAQENTPSDHNNSAAAMDEEDIFFDIDEPSVSDGSVSYNDNSDGDDHSEISDFNPLTWKSDDQSNNTDDECEEEERENPSWWRNMEKDEETGKFYWENEPTNEPDMPTATGWKKIHPTEMRRVKISFEEGEQRMIAVLKSIHDGLHKQLDNLDVPKNTLGLFKHLYGNESRLSQTMRKHLGLSHQKYAQFLATFYMSAGWSQPAKRLEESRLFNYDGFMPTKEYNAFWRKISECGKDGQSEKMWMAIQESLNADCREMFLSEQNQNRYIALDDDKIHHQFNRESIRKDVGYLCGLKPCQHVRDNRTGYTADTAVCSASGLPLHLSVLRQGETNQQNYERMVGHMYEHRHMNLSHAARSTELSGVTFCSDRGYWKAFLILFVLGLGATVFGTVQRLEWVPYTYDQVLKDKDKREKIEKKYGRSIFQAFGRAGHDSLKIVAYRPGTGNAVSLAMTSDCDEEDPQQVDFCMNSSADIRWYRSALDQNSRNLKAFTGTFLDGEDEETKKEIDEYLIDLASSNVQMLNVSDHCLDWFILRMFSFTSSSTEETLRHVAPFIQERFCDCYSSMKDVFTYAGLDSYLVASDNSDETDDEAEGGTSEEIDDPLVSTVVANMRSPTVRTLWLLRADVDRIKTALDDGLSSTATERILIALGFSCERAAAFSENDRKKKITKWIKSIKDVMQSTESDIESNTESDFDESAESIDQSNTEASHNDVEDEDKPIKYNFPYDMLSAVEIKDLLIRRFGANAVQLKDLPGPHKNPANNAQRKASLIWLDNNARSTTTTEPEQDDNSQSTKIRNAVILGTLKRAFLKGLKGDEKAAARLGHQMEPKYIEQYFNDSKAGKVPGVDLVDVRRCGLAMKKDNPFVRDSADGIGFEKQGCILSDFDEAVEEEDYFSPIKSHLIECKCRSGGGDKGSLKLAKKIRNKIAGIKTRQSNSNGEDNAYVAIESGQAIYLSLSVANDRDLLKRLIPAKSERIQLLHHAYTYGIRKVVYLVGNGIGLFFGLVITFDDELLQNYGRILRFLYHNGLDLFYGDSIDTLPMEVISRVLLSDPKLKSKFELNDFMTSYLIWRELSPGHPDSPMYPIPACNMVVPIEHSLWNSCKGGSDTTTRLAWNCQVVLPLSTPQTAVVARILMVYAVVFHQTRQIVTMKKAVDPTHQILSDLYASATTRDLPSIKQSIILQQP